MFQWKSWSQLPSITPYTCILLLLTIRVQGLEHLHMTECYSARLEPDILECETKWALGSIAMNKANRADEIQPEQLKILKDTAVKMLHSICQQIWKTQQWPQDRKRTVFILIPKKSTAKKGSNYHTIALISHDSKILLKILQARLQQYLNQERPGV